MSFTILLRQTSTSGSRHSNLARDSGWRNKIWKRLHIGSKHTASRSTLSTRVECSLISLERRRKCARPSTLRFTISKLTERITSQICATRKRSEERRVGKESRSTWSQDHTKKKDKKK